MLADVMKGADLAIRAAQKDDALVEEVEKHIGAGLGELVLMCAGMPCLVEDRLALLGEDIGVVEEPGRQGIGLTRVGNIPIDFLFEHRAASPSNDTICEPICPRC